MKIYLLAMIAALLAIGLSAFPTPKHVQRTKNSITVYFIGNPFDITEVDNPAFWVDSDPGLTCYGFTTRACSFEIDAYFYDYSNDHLDINLNLRTAGSYFSGYYVYSVDQAAICSLTFQQ